MTVVLASDGFMMAENWWRIVIGIAAVIVGFSLKEIADQVRERKKVKRLAYAIAVGSAMTNVPEALAEKIQVTFADQLVQGQLYEVTCTVTNSGYLVVKNQYLRFGFPTETTILQTYIVGDPPMELGVEEARLDPPRSTDRRWLIGQLEKRESVSFGFLVTGPTARPPTIYGHNDEGGVELVATGKLAREDDAARDLVLFTAPLILVLILPSGSNMTENLGFLFVKGVLILLAALRLGAVSALVAGYLTREPGVSGYTINLRDHGGPVQIGDRNSQGNYWQRPEQGPEAEPPPDHQEPD